MAELRNIKWNKLIKDFFSEHSLEILFKSRSLQWALTYCLRQQNHIVLNELNSLILEYRGIKFIPHPLNYPRMFEAYDRYKISTLTKDDIVLDLGANIGSFTLPAAKRAQQVTAVEPLFYQFLHRNIVLNELTSILVIPYSVGTWKVDCQEYKGCSKRYEITGDGFSFIRMDVGGAEWLFHPEDILASSVRRFEGEFHFWTKEQRKRACLHLWLDTLHSKGFGYIIRWSKHKHWAYVSADKSYKKRKEVQLKDGSFTGRSQALWRST